MTREKVEPKADMPATYGIGGDRYPVTVTRVSENGKRITIQFATRDESREFVPNPRGRREDWSLRQNGRWAPVGQAMNQGGYLYFGEYDDYRDPSF